MRWKKGRATSKFVWAVAVIVVLLAGAAYLASTSKPTPGAPTEIDIRIIEDNPVLQIDHFYPDSVAVRPGENVTLAIENGDDELRFFVLQAFNVNETIPAGTAVRVTFQVNQPPGSFLFYSPVTPPSPVSQGRPGPCLQGSFVITENATLLTTTTGTATGVPGSTNCLTTP